MSQIAISCAASLASDPLDSSIDPHATLFVPRRSRFVHHYVRGASGAPELFVYFGDKEIYFDEPELFPFAESLCRHDSFMAGAATQWARGEPYSWERVKGLLESLLAEGVLARDAVEPLPPSPEHPEYVAHQESEALRDAPAEPLWWNPDCAAILDKLVGRPLELGYLEAIVPVYRLAHPALDAEGRHVGEMNVFPSAMRMQQSTETRFCRYPGGRYDYPLPMNMTALNAMRKHWRPMMRAILLVREEVLRRFPLGADGAWKLGDLHALACAELAVATLLLMRGDAPVRNGELEPVLSSIFRVCDGVRMVAYYAIHFLDDPRPYDSTITPAELLHITEARDHFLSPHGACAGPPNMVKEFFATLLDGRPLDGEAPALGDWVSEVPRAVDYALYGIQLHAMVVSLWLRMAVGYEKIRDALDAARLSPGGPLARFRERVERDWDFMKPSHLDRPEQRAWEEERFAELFERAQRGRIGDGPVARLSDALTPPASLLGGGARARLRSLLHARTEDADATRALDDVTDALLEYLRVERWVLRTVVALQRGINALLRRPHPSRPLSGMDLAIYHSLRVELPGALPYLLHALRDELALEMENTESSTVVVAGDTRLVLD